MYLSSVYPHLKLCEIWDSKQLLNMQVSWDMLSLWVDPNILKDCNAFMVKARQLFYWAA